MKIFTKQNNWDPNKFVLLGIVVEELKRTPCDPTYMRKLRVDGQKAFPSMYGGAN
jgi:hypothetical protein